MWNWHKTFLVGIHNSIHHKFDSHYIELDCISFRLDPNDTQPYTLDIAMKCRFCNSYHWSYIVCILIRYWGNTPGCKLSKSCSFGKRRICSLKHCSRKHNFSMMCSLRPYRNCRLSSNCSWHSNFLQCSSCHWMGWGCIGLLLCWRINRFCIYMKILYCN